jgi:hypothetical protein
MTEKNEITKVPFYGQELITLEINGEAYVAMRSITDGMGLSWSTQRQKLERQKDKFNCVHMNTVAEDGKMREMLCLPVKKLNGWLFSINADKCRPDIREKVRTYQEECFQVLYDYFHKGAAINPLAGTERIVELFEQAIEKINQRDDVIRSQQKIIDSVTSDSVYGEQSEVTGLPKVVLVRQHFRSYAPCKKKKNKMQMVFDFFKGGKCNA